MKKSDLSMCYKILHGHVIGPPERYGLKLAPQPREGRGHNFKLFLEHSRVEARMNFFSVRVVKPWNFLPASLVNSASVRSFKLGINKTNLSKFLKITFDNDE